MAGWLALVYIAALVYGSLYPWSGWRSIGLSGFDFLWQPWPRYWTRFDLLTNLLLYVPVGATLAWRLRSLWRARWAALAATAAGCALSFSVESLQTFLPERVASNVDLLCNGLGAMAGALFALQVWPTRWRQQRLRLRPGEWVTVLLLIVWLVIQLLPQRIALESGAIVAPLLDQFKLASAGAADSLWGTLGAQVDEVFTPLARWMSWTTDYADIIEAAAVSGWVMVLGLLMANIEPLRWCRPFAIAALLISALVLRAAAAQWLFDASTWRFGLSGATQGGLTIGAVGLALLTNLERRSRLRALLVLLPLAWLLTNLIPIGLYDNMSAESTLQPAWRNLFGLLRAVATLWPVAALIAILSELRHCSIGSYLSRDGT